VRALEGSAASTFKSPAERPELQGPAIPEPIRDWHARVRRHPETLSGDGSTGGVEQTKGLKYCLTNALMLYCARRPFFGLILKNRASGRGECADLSDTPYGLGEHTPPLLAVSPRRWEQVNAHQISECRFRSWSSGSGAWRFVAIGSGCEGAVAIEPRAVAIERDGGRVAGGARHCHTSGDFNSANADVDHCPARGHSRADGGKGCQ